MSACKILHERESFAFSYRPHQKYSWAVLGNNHLRFFYILLIFHYFPLIFAHILALALAPGGALPPQTGACRPPACAPLPSESTSLAKRGEHKRDIMNLRRRPRMLIDIIPFVLSYVTTASGGAASPGLESSSPPGTRARAKTWATKHETC